MDIIARIFNFSLMIGLPLVLAVYFSRKLKTEWKLFGIGCATFVISQVFHIPFNQWVLNPLMASFGFSVTQSGIQLAIVGLFYGLSAGLFEELTRYLGYRFWIRENRDWKSALMYGAGHGGIEAIILGVLVLVAFVQIMALRGQDLASLVPADQLDLARSQIEAYWAAPWPMALLGAVERVIAIVFHISATVLVLESFRRKNFIWVIYAILWHTLLDAVAVFAAQTWNPYITEGILGVFGLLSLGLIFWLRSEAEPVSPESDLGASDLSEIQPVDLTEDHLEDSRYV
jgi:uncharacterized membrane protein YhfC